MPPATEPVLTVSAPGGFLSRVEAFALCGVAVWLAAVLALILSTRY